MNTSSVTQPEYHWIPVAWLQFWIELGRRQTEQAMQVTSAMYAAWMNVALQSTVQLLETTAASTKTLEHDNGKRRRNSDE